MNAVAVAPTSTVANDIDFCKRNFRAIDVCMYLLPHGHADHKEWLATNPTRADETEGSFSVNIEIGGPKEGIWGEFAGGIQLKKPNGKDRIGGDIVDLWKYIRGLGNSYQAAKEMRAELEGRAFPPPSFVIPTYEPRDDDSIECILPIPSDAPGLGKVIHGLLGRPTQWPMHHYQTPDGRTIGYVARWDLPDGGKEIRPYFLHRCRDGNLRWLWEAPNRVKPLYGLERINRTTLVLYIVEGEKAADAGQVLAPPRTAVLTWMGGCNAVGQVDVSMIRPMPVVLIPDQDAALHADGSVRPYDEQPGLVAMLTLGKMLEARGCTVSIVDYTPDRARHGWDLADAINEKWDAERLQTHIMEHLRPLTQAPAIDASLFENLGHLRFDTPLDPQELECRGARGTKPISVWQNVAKILAAHGIICRQNLMRDEQEFVHHKTQKIFDVNELPSMIERNGMACSERQIKCHLSVISFKNAYHPAYDWVRSAPWDGIDRIVGLFKTLTISETPRDLAFKLFYRTMIQAVAMMSQEVTNEFGELPEAHGVLTFVGHQGIGKSRWIRHLAPPRFSLPGHVLTVGDKDSEIAAISRWIVELGEVSATHGKSGSAKLKAWLGKSYDTIRKHYDARARDMPRRSVFFASENHVQYLIDETGNRRWWTIRVDSMDYKHTVNMQQLWAQALHLLRQGEQWWLTDAEMHALNENNERHKQTCPVSDMISGGLLWNAPRDKWTWRKTSRILMDVYYPRPENPAACRAAAIYLRSRGCPEKTIDKSSAFAVPPIGQEVLSYFPELAIGADDAEL